MPRQGCLVGEEAKVLSGSVFYDRSSARLRAVLKEYRGRWSVEILIREAKESFGLGKDRCRNARKIAGINNFHLLIRAAEVLYRAEVSQIETTTERLC